MISAALEIQVGNKTDLYASMEESTAKLVQDATKNIKSRTKTMMEQIVLNGNDLLIIKSKLNHGQFTTWLTLEFQWSEDTAQTFMRTAEHAKANPMLFKMQPSVAYEYSKKSFPESAREEVNKLIESGKKVSVAQVKEIKAKAKESKPQPLFHKGQIVEVEGLLGQIESIHTFKNQDTVHGFEYRLKKLHGPFIKGKYSERRLTLCPVQSRQSFFDDCTNKPKPGCKVVYCPITSSLQDLKGKIFTVLASLADSVCIRDENDKKIHAHWAELKPYEPVESKAEESVVIDVQATEVEENAISTTAPFELSPSYIEFDKILPLIGTLSDLELDFLIQQLIQEKEQRKRIAA